MSVQAYAFVAVTTRDLGRARKFWCAGLGFSVTEDGDDYFIVDAGGLRLCVDLEDGETHVAGGTDPVIGLLVDDLDATLAELATRGVLPAADPTRGTRGAHVHLVDPDGRKVILTESP